MTILIFCILMLLLYLDAVKKIDLLTGPMRFLYFLIVPHFPFIFYCCLISDLSLIPLIFLALGLATFHLYSTIRMHFVPFRRDESGNTRIRIEYGGMLLLKAGILGIFLQILLYLILYLTSQFFLPSLFDRLDYGISFATALFFTFDIIYTCVFILLFLLNGGIRVICTCRRLGIVKRVLICLNLWIPVVNLFLAHAMCRAVKDEYAIAVTRRQNAELRPSSNACKTKYPLIMVHGIGFRDLKYFNYWGRIPRILQKNGACVYYGHQKAWGTIEENAAAIAQTIDKALQETGADKVNIIAHSKGGLDSRYLISHLGYADKIASLTTMSTPHRGSELIPFLNKLPDGIYRWIAGLLDHSSAQLGDEHPDCYHASKQLDPAFCSRFNETTPDSPQVYYQSYASVMKNCFSDALLSVPYFFMKLLSHEPNDGLVTESSAKWGQFQGTLQSRKRGISHGDMIDLKREDIKGFDVLECYIQLVENLKEEGF